MLVRILVPLPPLSATGNGIIQLYLSPFDAELLSYLIRRLSQRRVRARASNNKANAFKHTNGAKHTNRMP